MWVSFQSLLSCAFCEQEGWSGDSLSMCASVGNGVRNPAHQGLFCKRPWRLEDDRLQYYCTSTVMVWVAATRAWSFVAPVTVIWCVPLLRPLKVP